MIGVVVLATLVIAVVAGAVAFNNPRVVAGTVTIAAAPETVYELVGDLKAGWSRWSPLVPSAGGVALEYGAHTSGEGARVEWTGKAGNGSLMVTGCVPGARLSYRTVLSIGGMSGSGELRLEGGPSGTLVSWSDALSVGGNPIWRWLAFAMDGLRKSNVQRGLAALKQAAEQEGGASSHGA